MSAKNRLIPYLAVCVMLIVGPGVSVFAADALGIHRLQGRWRYAGDDSERQRRLDAIEVTVQQMSWFARGIARKRITASTGIHDSYVFRVDGPTVTISEDDLDGHTTRRDGRPLEVTKNDGGPATLTRTWKDGTLKSHWRQSKGEGIEIYRVSEDGETMTVSVIVSSRRLPADIRYDLTYRRESGLPSAFRKHSDG